MQKNIKKFSWYLWKHIYTVFNQACSAWDNLLLGWPHLVWVISTPWTSLSPLPGEVNPCCFCLDCGERSIISNTLPSSPGAGWRGRREAERQPLHVGSWSTPWSSYQWLSSDAFLMRNCGVLSYRIQNTDTCILHIEQQICGFPRPTCISGNGSQEFSPLWQQFEKDTADKKTIIIYKCILCQCWLQNDVDDKLMILLMTFVMVVTIKMMAIIMMIDNRNNDERSLHQKTNCVWAREQLRTMFWSAVEQTWVFRQWRWWR